MSGNNNKNGPGGLSSTNTIYERLRKLKIQGETEPASPVIHRVSSAPAEARRSRDRPQSLMAPASRRDDASSSSVERRPRPQSLIMTSRRSAERDRRMGLDLRGPGTGLDLQSRRPPARLPLNNTSNNATNGNNSKLFEFEHFKDELRINGTQYTVTASDFESIRHLGEGACGSVQEMRHKSTGTHMAVKRMRRTQDIKEQRRIFTDLNIVIKQHNCPNIINSFGAFITEQDVCICMEPMDTCLDKLQRKMAEKGMQGIPEHVLGQITVGVLRGLDFLKREYSVIHRDVKPSNILIDRNGQVKICDFGIAGNLVDSKVKTRDQGCPAYMSPERIDPPDQDNPTYDIRADVWSLGITLIELARKYPYNNTAVQFSLMADIVRLPAPALSVKDGFSEEFVGFVGFCLIKDVRKRPKYGELLEHAFIKKHATVDRGVVADWYCTNFLD